MLLSLRDETLGDSALIENLDRAGEHPSGTGADQIRGWISFDDGDVDAGQRQLAGKHESRGPAASDQH